MHIEGNKLIAECTAYDFKQEVERKKIKSWLKSVSAFANTEGGSLFFGVNNDGIVVGLEHPQQDAEFISENIKARLDPIPEMTLTPMEHDGKVVLEVHVKAGALTPYYYYQDGTRTAFVRVGNESVECNAQQLLPLVLKGSGRTWDSLDSHVPASKHSFRILANTYEKRTHQPWDDKLVESFGLVTGDGMLTNAGLLFVDNCPVYQSRSFCTRWRGLEKDDAINDSEYQGNILYLLEMTTSFIRANTATRWYKLPSHRLNIPEYSDRAVLESTVNHLIHRDYVEMGSELHVDIFDDRMCFYTPGGMYDGGEPIQDRDINTVPSRRRNPVIADVFSQLDLMEKRGSGLKKMQHLSSTLPTFDGIATPVFKSDARSFFTTFRNINYGKTEEDFQRIIGDNGTGIFGVGKEKTTQKTTQKEVRNIGKTAQLILDIVISDPTTTIEQMAYTIGISSRAVKKQIAKLQAFGLLLRLGAARGGLWKVTTKSKD